MKSVGIVRKIDSLGRVVIPKEIRKVHMWEEGTPLEIYIDGSKIIMNEFKPGCVFCGVIEEKMQFR